MKLYSFILRKGSKLPCAIHSSWVGAEPLPEDIIGHKYCVQKMVRLLEEYGYRRIAG